MSHSLVLGLLLILLVLTIGLPLVRRLAAKPPPRVAATPPKPSPPDDGEEMRNAPTLPGGDRIVGQVRRDSLKTVGDIVEKHPGEAVSVIRRWIRSDRPPES